MKSKFRHLLTIKALLPLLMVILTLITRFSFLTKLPNGLHWDEVAYAYNSLSLMETGRDEWGRAWPLFLKSFGEYKPALLSYILMPFLQLPIEKNLAVRLVAATIGSLGIFFTYHLVKKLTQSKKTAYLTTLFLILSPWHMHYSRVTLDPILSHTLLIGGLLAWLNQQRWLKTLGSLLLIVAMYSYHSAKIFVPLFIGFHLLKQKNKNITWSKLWKTYRIPLTILILGTIWLGWQTFWGLGGTRTRIMLELNNSYWRYWQHFLPKFLFLGKDPNGQSWWGFMRYGHLLLATLPFAYWGLLQTFVRKRKSDIFFLFSLWLAPMASGLTPDAPHSGRALIMLPAWSYFTAIGLVSLYQLIKLRSTIWGQVFIGLTSLLILINTTIYARAYYQEYPTRSEWFYQGHQRQLATFLQTHGGKYQKIYFSPNTDLNNLLVLAWYLDLPPTLVQQRNNSLELKKVGRLTKLNTSSFNPCLALENKALLVAAPNDISQQLKPLKTIYYESGQAVIKIYDQSSIVNQSFIYNCKQLTSFN